MRGPSVLPHCSEALDDRELAFSLASQALDWIERTRTAEGAAELLEEFYGDFDTRLEKNGSKWVFVPDPSGLIELCQLALGGDAVADKVIRKKAADAIEEGQPVPPEIRNYVAEGLRTPRKFTKRGRRKEQARDLMIADAVSILERIGGYKRYADPTSNRDCACSIVAEMLKRRRMAMGLKRLFEIVAERLGPVRGK